MAGLAAVVRVALPLARLASLPQTFGPAFAAAMIGILQWWTEGVVGGCYGGDGRWLAGARAAAGRCGCGALLCLLAAVRVLCYACLLLCCGTCASSCAHACVVPLGYGECHGPRYGGGSIYCILLSPRNERPYLGGASCACACGRRVGPQRGGRWVGGGMVCGVLRGCAWVPWGGRWLGPE